MQRALLLVLLMAAAVWPAAGQSCATLGSQPDCRAAPSKPPAKSPQAHSAETPRAERDVQTQGYSETTVSNSGVSTTLENRVVDQNGIVEFGFHGSTQKPCRRPGYGTLCE